MIEVSELRKSYGALEALKGLSLSVKPGEVFGLLGHNGAGKSTFAKILSGLVLPDSGEARVAGHVLATDPLAARTAFGYLPEESVLYEELTAWEHLELFARLRGLDPERARTRAARLFDFFDLGEAVHRPVAGYSRGMRRKAAIALAVLPDPPALLFDEPTGGLDPEGARRFAELLAELRRRERAVIVQSHILGLVEKRCDRIGVLDHGVLVACGTLEELRTQAGLPAGDLEDLLAVLTGRSGKDAREVFSDA
ncbi:MAG: ABC transporter ATP-binding protein [Planctomycetes bacterium]|nr:ABC transporter ATP-binding protein [Planctomycetota bacterium]